MGKYPYTSLFCKDGDGRLDPFAFSSVLSEKDKVKGMRKASKEE